MSARLWSQPALAAVILVCPGSLTETGVSLSMPVVPSPSWPKPLAPQALSEPAFAAAGPAMLAGAPAAVAGAAAPAALVTAVAWATAHAGMARNAASAVAVTQARWPPSPHRLRTIAVRYLSALSNIARSSGGKRTLAARNVTPR